MLVHYKSNITVAPELTIAANGKTVAKLLAATNTENGRMWLNASLWEDAAEQLAAADIKPGDFAVISLIDPVEQTYTKRNGEPGESITGQVRALKIMRKGRKGAVLALTVATARELAIRGTQEDLPLEDTAPRAMSKRI